MAKKVELKERGTNETMYPITSIKNIPDFPLTDTPNMVLRSTGNKEMEWVDLSKIMFDTYSYGVSWKLNVADPSLTRVGNKEYHVSLPIQSGMKGCIYNPKEKRVVYWLDPDDWRDKESNMELIGVTQQQSESTYHDVPSRYYPYFGKYSNITLNDYRGVVTEIGAIDETTNTFQIKVEWDDLEAVDKYLWQDTFGEDHIFYLGSNLSGFDGEVMVYVPEFWIKSWRLSDHREVRISTIKLDNTWEHHPAMFVGAYRETVLNAVPENMGYLSTLEANTAVCVANTETYCRGGGNLSSWDKYFTGAEGTTIDVFRTQLGKPRTSISRGTMRAYERKAGKEVLSYNQYKALYWLWVIEYATFNSQATFNNTITSEGYSQGGMGPGITTMSNWGEYNGYYPICTNGYTNDLGNNTEIKNLVIPEFTYTNKEGVEVTRAAQTLKAFRWRGIENFFGDIWTNVDGIIIDADADNHLPVNTNFVYTTNNPSNYGDSIDNIKNMILAGLEIHAEGYIKEWSLGNTAEIIPLLNGGGTTTYKCDYHYVGSKNTSLRTLILGGHAAAGATAGLGRFYSNSGAAYSDTSVGFRASCLA